ncbi:MAG TPA: PHP domain-containing protein, partial [Terriglobales bacterium]|nr:PHP domain-containing protein [Terriglobales bacterium]
MYVEFHSRSAFSFLEGSSLPEELAGVCAQLGMPAMALLDRDGVYGAPRFYLAAKKLGLRAHIGAEITFYPGKEFQVSSFELHNPSRRAQPETRNLKPETARLPLLASSRTGYQNLCRLITRMKMRGPKDAPPEQIAATMNDLAQFSPGLICLTGDEHGLLASALSRGGMATARAALEPLIHIFGRENVYVELQRHFQREQEARN